MTRTARLLTVLSPGLVAGAALAAALLGMPGAAEAQAEPPALFRFYYSQWFTGRLNATPADPTGEFSDRSAASHARGDLEVILFQRVGLSFTRQKVDREYTDDRGIAPGCTAPCAVDEASLQRFYNLTLYAWPSRHGAFNLFAGGGRGSADYQLKVDGVPQDDSELHGSIPLRRWYGGVEYTFERIGFRLELMRVLGEEEKAGQRAEIDQTFQYLTVYIPFN